MVYFSPAVYRCPHHALHLGAIFGRTRLHSKHILATILRRISLLGLRGGGGVNFLTSKKTILWQIQVLC